MRDQIWKMLVVAVLTGPALVLTGCKSDGDGDAGDDVVLADPVAILGSKTGSSELLDSVGVMLVKTQDEYAALGDAQIMPDVDFEKHDLVIVALGEQPTGGYSIEITALQLEGDTLVVVGKSGAPGPDAAVTQALTYPYAAVVIDNTPATKVQPAID